MPGSPQLGQSPLVSRSPSVQQQRRSVVSLPASEPDDEADRTAASSQQGTPTLGVSTAPQQAASYRGFCLRNWAPTATLVIHGVIPIRLDTLGFPCVVPGGVVDEVDSNVEGSRGMDGLVGS